MTRSVVCRLLVGTALAGASPAFAVPLSTLTAGGTITEGDVTFSGFSFSDAQDGEEQALNPDPADIDVTASSTATSVTLLFDFDPALLAEQIMGDLSEDLLYDISIGFTTSVTSSRLLNNLGIEQDDTAVGGDDAFVLMNSDSFTLGSDTVPMLSTERDTLEPTPILTDSTALGPVASVGYLFDVRGEVFEDGSTATVTQLSVTFGLEDGPTGTDVPLPAGLPLMLGGLAGIALVARRKR